MHLNYKGLVANLARFILMENIKYHENVDIQLYGITIVIAKI